MAILRSASAETMMALLPPNSSRLLPSRAATVVPIALPIRVDPVAEISGIRVSAASQAPTSRPPVTRQLTPSGTPLTVNTLAMICWQATAQSGVFSDGFQTQVLPQTQASMLFQLQTATG